MKPPRLRSTERRGAWPFVPFVCPFEPIALYAILYASQAPRGLADGCLMGVSRRTLRSRASRRSGRRVEKRLTAAQRALTVTRNVRFLLFRSGSGDAARRA